jgi:hypothetical protein
VGYSEIPQAQIRWLCDRYGALDSLRELPEPLDGLAVLYQCIQRRVGNPFLDVPGGVWQIEYVDIYAWYWNPGVINALTEDFSAVERKVERLTTFRRWCRPEDHRSVIDYLTAIGNRLVWVFDDNAAGVTNE